MRITNAMVTNQMLLNINKNANSVNKYYKKLYTGYEITKPSEDPIIAARSLRFSTNISETKQYQKNVDYGLSWMEITDEAFDNTSEIMVNKMSELLVQGATDTLSYKERQKIATEINSLFEQITQNELNVTYAGRYVLSGYRTDEPASFITDNDKLSYEINQSFTVEQMENVYTYQKESATDQSNIQKNNVFRLPYSGGAGDLDIGTSMDIKDKDGNVLSTATVNSVKRNDADAYNPPAGTINYIEETGELIVAEDIKTTMGQNNGATLDVTYTKTGFLEGELNPKVYFNCTQLTDESGAATGVDYSMDSQSIKYEVGVGVSMEVNSLAKDMFTSEMYAKFKSFGEIFQYMSVSTESDLTAKFKADNPTLSDDEIAKLVEKQLTTEENNLKSLGQNLFSEMIDTLGKFESTLSTEQTDLGTRMNRLELTKNRLSEDEYSYTELFTSTIGTDYTSASMKLTSSQSIYQAAMQVGANIMQISLVNYL